MPKKTQLARISATYEVTPPSDDDDTLSNKKGQQTPTPPTSSNFLSPTFARVLSQSDLGGPSRHQPSVSSSRRSSLRDKLSTASSYLSLFLEQPKKYLEDKCGFFLALSSGLLLTFYSALYQRIKQDVARVSILVLRGSLQFFALMGLAYAMGIPLRPKDLDKLPSSRAVFWSFFASAVCIAGLRLNAIFAALQIAPMAIVHTLINGSPVLVMLLSHCLLNRDDPFTRMKALASVMLIAGIVLNTNPVNAIHEAMHANNLETAIGIGLSLLALFLSAFGSIFTKKISAHVDKLHISAYIGGSILLFSLLGSYADEILLEAHTHRVNNGVNVTLTVNHTSDGNGTATDFGKIDLSCLVDRLNGTDFEALDQEVLESCEPKLPPYFPANADVWSMAVVVAVLGIAQQFCLIAAIKRDTPSRVTMTRSVSIIFSFFVQIWQEPSAIPSWNQWLGAVIILAAIFLVSMDHLAERAWGAVKERFVCCSNDETKRTRDVERQVMRAQPVRDRVHDSEHIEIRTRS